MELQIMRKILAIVAGACFGAAISTPMFAADMTVKGEVVDVACALTKGDAGKGEGHAACAMSCAKGGRTVGILTADDVIFEVTGDYAAHNNARLLDFVAKKVEVTGEVSERSGKKLMAVKAIKLQ
jgi:type 1 fimbria pilin